MSSKSSAVSFSEFAIDAFLALFLGSGGTALASGSPGLSASQVGVVLEIVPFTCGDIAGGSAFVGVGCRAAHGHEKCR